MGVNVVEREGISFSHPAEFILVGTMNPEEGDLRPQLLDRFGLAVDMAGIHDPKLRVEIVKRRIAYEQDADDFGAEWEPRERELSGRIQQARDLLPLVAYTDRDLYAIAALTGDFKVDGHRADIVILKAARAHAAYEGRMAISDRDILLAAELALPHRMKRQPFQEAVLDQSQLEQKLRQAQEQARSEMTETTGATEMADPSKKALRGPNR
jgi:Mg-chelatase subunit ChlI